MGTFKGYGWFTIHGNLVMMTVHNTKKMKENNYSVEYFFIDE